MQVRQMKQCAGLFTVFWLIGIVGGSRASADAPRTTDDQLLVGQFVEAHGGKDIAERIDGASVRLLGLPFSWFPLGEGPDGEFDKRPLFRFDTFDCSTWVETVLALATARTFDDFANRMRHIRYARGIVSFQTRNHLPDVDWIANNVKSGLLADATRTVAGDIPLKSSTIRNSRRQWYSKFEDERVFLPEQSPAERKRSLDKLRRLVVDDSPVISTAEYIPFDALLVPKEKAGLYKAEDLRPLVLRGNVRENYPRDPKNYFVNEALFRRIPTPCLIQVIKPGWDRRDVYGLVFNIGHRGILSRKADGTIMFQQMSLRLKRSIEIPLEEDLFLRLVDPPVKGFNFYEIKDPP